MNKLLDINTLWIAIGLGFLCLAAYEVVNTTVLKEYRKGKKV